MTMPMLPGPQKDFCACGCQLFGRPRTGKCAGHIRGCACPKCRGGRNRQAGLKKQRAAAKALNIPKGASMRSGQEEHWGGGVRVEVKSGKQVSPVITRFRLARDQSEVHRALGDHRPFLWVTSFDGLTLGTFVLDQAANIAAGLAENLGRSDLGGHGEVEDPADGADGQGLDEVAPLVGSQPGLSPEADRGVVDAVNHTDSVQGVARSGNGASVSFPTDLEPDAQYDATLDLATGRLTMRRADDV